LFKKPYGFPVITPVHIAKRSTLREKSSLSILARYRARRRVGVREKLDFLVDAFEDGRLVWIVEVQDGWRDNG